MAGKIMAGKIMAGKIMAGKIIKLIISPQPFFILSSSFVILPVPRSPIILPPIILSPS